MVNIKKRVTVYLIFMSFVCFASSQTTVVESDLATWSSIGVEADLTKRFNFELQEQFRLEKNSSTLDEFFTSASIKYTIIKKRLKFGAGYRFIYDQTDELIFDKEQRFNFDLTYQVPVNQFRFKTRFRYTNRNDIGEKSIDGDFARQYLRLRFQTEYKIRNWKLDPVVSVEFFRRYEKYTLPYFSDIRFRIGTSYNMNEFGKIEAFYQIDQELEVSYPQTTYVIGVGYKYDFGKIYKKFDK